jgi:thymidylate kinase
MRRNGLFIVLLGPDGSGKSAVVSLLKTLHTDSYANLYSFHWRPGLLGKPYGSKKVDNNNTLPPEEHTYKYGIFLSLVRFIYYWLDFVIGYWVSIFPKRYNNYLIIGERWYFDTVIQPYRYGFNLPKWFLKIAGSIIPKPDLVILLSADPKVIFARKPELPLDLIERQLRKMEQVLHKIDNHETIDTGKDIEETKQELNNLLTKYKL